MAESGRKKKEAPRAEKESGHGAAVVGPVEVLSYNLEIEDEDGFVGDKANKGAFVDFLEQSRRLLRKSGEDPLDAPAKELSRKEIDALLLKGSAREASLVLTAIEDYAQSLAAVMRRFLRAKSWKEVKRVAVGGGFRESRVGELAIGRASLILQAAGRAIELTPIRHDPDHAGLIGAAHLAPEGLFVAFDRLIGVDIGGSNIRCGIVKLDRKKPGDFSKAEVGRFELWRHADDGPRREEAIGELGEMIGKLVRDADKKRLAPFIGVGCPGIIEDDGAIRRGAQNLPGDWTSSRFNLVERLKGMVPTIGDRPTMVSLHNDAVVQGLSQASFMEDVRCWGVLTVGTGLGNAAFRNHAAPRKQED